jgi:tetratricopeptide (TPR) repeat protein
MHISRTLVELVLRGELPRRFLDEIGQEHLDTLCSVCSDGLEALARGSEEAPGPRPELSADPLEPVRRRLRLTLSRLQVEVDEAEAREWLKRFFRKVPADERHETVRGAYKRYRGSLFGTLLLEEARRAIPEDPAESLSLADSALISCLETRPKDPDPLVRVPALAVRGNAKRALGRLREAEEDLKEARRVLDRSDLDDLLIAAEIDFYMGSLRKDQYQLEEATRYLDRAGALYSLVGDQQKTAATFVKLGIVHHRLHRFDAAIASIAEALELLEGGSEDWLRAYARFNLALFLHSLGDIERAEQELDAHHELIAEAGESLVFRAGWLRARIAWSRDDLGKAQRLFKEAFGRAMARDLRYEAGLICLERALIHLIRGQTARVRKLAADALRILASEEEVEGECRGALDLLKAATRRDALTREILEQAISELERAGSVRRASPASSSPGL